MLKKANRLKSNASYNATYKNKDIISSDFLILYAGKLKENKDYPTKVGFVVSKKIHKRAVKRNRIKRLIRENIRLIFKSNKCEAINNYQSLIILPKYDISEKKYKDVYNSVLILLNKLANKNI